MLGRCFETWSKWLSEIQSRRSPALALVTVDRCLNVFREDLEDSIVSGFAP